MAEIRLNKIIRQFNIGLDDLVNFLQKIGVELDANPNAKIDESYMPAISKQFGKDLEIKQAADKVDIKIKEIIEKGRKQPKEEEVEDDQEHETIIKSNTLSGDKPSEVKKTSEVKASAEEEKSAPAEPVAPQKEEVTEPAPKVAEPEPKPVPKPEPEEERRREPGVDYFSELKNKAVTNITEFLHNRGFGAGTPNLSKIAALNCDSPEVKVALFALAQKGILKKPDGLNKWKK